MFAASKPTISSNLTPFEKEILTGLSSTSKYLSSKYFYDDKGSQLFQEIMQLPEYYLTRSEFEIFETYKQQFYTYFSEGTEAFDCIELGAGDGLKTQVLLSHFVEQSKKFRYIPIDISTEALYQLKLRFQKNIPQLMFEGIQGEYFEALRKLDETETKRKVILFLGSNIGNFGESQSIEFLTNLRKTLRKGDKLLLGFDLKKHPHTLKAAYDDAQGITKAFNLNLLQRINIELGANFDITKFDFYSFYVPETGEVRSYLVSNAKQKVYLSKVDTTISFEWGETIHTEISRKYSIEQMKNLASQVGFVCLHVFTDCKGYFADGIFEAV